MEKKTFRVYRMVETWYSTEVEAESAEDAISIVENEIEFYDMDESNSDITDVYNAVELDEDGDEIEDYQLYRDGKYIAQLKDIEKVIVDYKIKDY